MTTTSTTPMASPSLMLKSTLAKDILKYEKDEKKFLSMAKIRCQDNTPYQVKFEGEICTGGVNASEFNNNGKKKTSYSLGITIEEGSAYAFLFQQLAGLAHAEASVISSDMEFNEPIKDEKFYLKLKTDANNKAFAFKSNLNITPKKCSEVVDYDRVTFTGEAAVWFNISDEKYGLSFTPKRIDFSKSDE